MRRTPLLLLVAVALLSAGCKTETGGGSGEAGEVTIYSGRTKNLIDPLLQRFSTDTGVAVNVRYGDSADLALQIESEGDRSPADVFLSQSPGALSFLSAHGRLRSLPDSTLSRVDPAYRSHKGEWIGTSGRARVLVYDRTKVKPEDLPRSVFDVTGPAFRDQVAVAPSNGSFQDFVTAMRQHEGDDRARAFLRGLRENGARTYANNTAIVEAVGRGEITYGLVNHYYNERARIENPGVNSANHSFPAEDLGNLVLVSGVAPLARSTNPAAVRLIDYLLEKDAQEYFAKETQEYPLAAGVAPAVLDMPPLASIKSPPEDLDSLSDLAVTARLIDESGLAGG
jgi:iron(III) transport system substrate-binding protein